MDILGLIDGLFASISTARTGELPEDAEGNSTDKIGTHVEKTQQAAHKVMAQKRLAKMKTKRQEKRVSQREQRHQNQLKR